MDNTLCLLFPGLPASHCGTYIHVAALFALDARRLAAYGLFILTDHLSFSLTKFYDGHTFMRGLILYEIVLYYLIDVVWTLAYHE